MKNLKLYTLFTLILVFISPIFSQEVEAKESIMDIILGGMEFNYFMAMLLFALVGTVVNVVLDVQKRDKPSKYSPEKFSISYWFKDNWRRLVATIILIPVVMLASVEFMGVELTKGVAFGIGFGADKLIEIAKHKKLKMVKGAGLNE